MSAEAGGEAWQWHGLVLDGTLGRADAGVRPPATSVYPMAWAHAWGIIAWAAMGGHRTCIGGLRYRRQAAQSLFTGSVSAPRRTGLHLEDIDRISCSCHKQIGCRNPTSLSSTHCECRSKQKLSPLVERRHFMHAEARIFATIEHC